MTAATTSRPPAPSRPHLVPLVAVALAYVAALVAVAPALRVPAHLERVTIVNPYPWPATVTTTRAGHTDTWNGVGTVDRETTQTFLEVIDQGDNWTVQFDYLGHHVDMQTTRTRLERDDWRITVPDQFATRLRDAHVRETPS